MYSGNFISLCLQSVVSEKYNRVRPDLSKIAEKLTISSILRYVLAERYVVRWTSISKDAKKLSHNEPSVLGGSLRKQHATRQHAGESRTRPKKVGASCILNIAFGHTIDHISTGVVQNQISA